MNGTLAPPRRSRGGQPGNSNSLRHGFYSHSFKRLENSRLEQEIEGGFKDEEALLRILIDRTVTSMQEKDLSHEEWIIALRAVSLAIGRLESIHRSRKLIFDQATSLDKALEELKYIPMEED